MSKLYSEYQKLKSKNSQKIYLFKSGIFYISLDEDAKILSELFDFEIIDNNYSKIDNYSDYYKNENLKSIINSIIELDMNDISFKQAFEILNNLHIKLKEIYKS